VFRRSVIVFMSRLDGNHPRNVTWNVQARAANVTDDVTKSQLVRACTSGSDVNVS
jgi:hypothetical protein